MLALSLLLQVAAPSSVEQTGSFVSPRVTESSGVAVAADGTLWTINDSGDGPFLYRTDLRGRDLGVVRVAGAAAIDWEDLAAGPCPIGGGRCLYIADTGDNLQRRPSVAVYAVREPPGPDPRDTTAVTDTAWTLHLRYPDGPEDAEAVFVTADGDLHLVTKGRRGTVRLLRVPAGDTAMWRGSSVITATVVQQLDFVPDPRAGRWVTGAALSPDGQRIAVRTYADLRIYEWTAERRLRQVGPTCDLLGLEPQGEAVTFLDDGRMVLTSEADRTPAGTIHVIRCP